MLSLTCQTILIYRKVTLTFCCLRNKRYEQFNNDVSWSFLPYYHDYIQSKETYQVYKKEQGHSTKVDLHY